MLEQIEQYWTKRAASYSEVVQYEMAHENEENWMRVITQQLEAHGCIKVLDIGTGPGFFATCLAKRGYEVTAVDYTQSMLDQAKFNAGVYADRIDFRRMDAQNMDFEDGTFDAIVTRNLTWNLEDPQRAYKEWKRVLKKGGIMLNFDAGWYNYLFDDNKAAEFEKSRAEVQEQGIFDYNDYSESDIMEDISRKLILSRMQRPEADLAMLEIADFAEISVDRHIGERVWDETEKVNYQSTPMFMLKAVK